MKRVLGGLCGGLLIAALVSSTIWAQATAQINGTVKDATGAVLPGVEIMAVQTDTGIIRSTDPLRFKLNAFAQSGDVHILSQPNLSAVSLRHIPTGKIAVRHGQQSNRHVIRPFGVADLHCL